jgi:membrane-associated protease RseP (regulator of RpoE activity)
MEREDAEESEAALSDSEVQTALPEPETPPQAPQPEPVPQGGSSPGRDGWFKGGLRCGAIAAIVVVVAGAFFTIGWFTSTRGDHGYPAAMKGINQQMNMRERGGSQGGADQRGMRQWQGGPRRGRGTVPPRVAPQQGPDENRTFPGSPSQPNSQLSQQAYLGVGVATVTPQLQRQYSLSSSSGVLVVSLDGSGPAVKAGIRHGDVITGIDGVSVTREEDVVAFIATKKVGESVSVTVDRAGTSLTFRVPLAARSGSVTG